MNILLTGEIERFVQEKMKDGGFASAEDVVRNALEMWKEQEELTPEDVEELRAELAPGLEQSDRGESEPLDMDEIRAEVRRLRGGK